MSSRENRPWWEMPELSETELRHWLEVPGAKVRVWNDWLVITGPDRPGAFTTPFDIGGHDCAFMGCKRGPFSALVKEHVLYIAKDVRS